jgi:hypothetical protein
LDQHDVKFCPRCEESIAADEKEYTEAVELLMEVQEKIVESALELVLEWHRSKVKIESSEDAERVTSEDGV